VALKMILSGSHAGEDELARFRTEAETISRLQHPGIVQIFEVGLHQGKAFLSLEFCPGGSLEQKLRGTPLPPADAAALVEKLAGAVQAAHQANVIHRDLKPANVLLAGLTIEGPTVREGAGGGALPHGRALDAAPKITDFGLAKKLDQQGPSSSEAGRSVAVSCSELYLISA
jgi:serine/threonine protein kinase